MQFDQLKRRDFITLLGGAAAAWPAAAHAQQTKMPVIGLLSSGSLDVGGRLGAFRQGLSEAGYTEGRNVAIEYRWAEGQNDRLPAMAAALVGRQVTVIAALGNLPTVLAAKAATTTIPIVFELPVDPVAAGIVSSLNRPGGNITGVTNFNVELGPKRLELLHELVPTATTMALLFDPTTSVDPDIGPKVLQEAAASLGLKLAVLRASTERDLDSTFASLAQLRAGALMIAGGGLLNRRVEQLATLAARYAVPASHSQREFATAGGLMSYRSILADQYRLAGVYTGRILDGKKPADLPIQQPTKFELIINLRAAKALGLTVPLSLLASADEVIE